MQVAVLGGGFVGVTTAVVLAEQGHDVDLVETDPRRRQTLEGGRAPFWEPGVDEALAGAMESGSLRVRGDVAIEAPDLAFLCVGTPSRADGSCDTGQVQEAAEALASASAFWGRQAVVVVKSTVPPGTCRGVVLPALERVGEAGQDFGLASNPEFLREGSALEDARRPDRVVYGSLDALATKRLGALYGPEQAPVVATSLETAEMVKYVSNAFLATKISFANEMANIAERVGVAIDEVMDAVGLDARINRAFLHAGAGFGGSCFPKDVAALRAVAGGLGLKTPVLDAVEAVNEQQPLHVVEQVRAALSGLEGRRIALLGLAFKAGTDDVRQSRALPMVRALVEAGATVVGHDPRAGEAFQALMPGVRIAATIDDVVADADAVIVQAQWPEYKGLASADVAARMRSPVLADPRRHLDGAAAVAAGFHYIPVGAPGRRP